MKGIPVILALVALFTIACLCSSSAPTSTPPEKIGEATQAPVSTPTTASARFYGVGDIIQAGDLTITLNSATFQDTTVDVNFTVENKGSEETTISTLLQFSAKDSSGTDLEEEIFECGPGLGGTIIAGDLSKGSVCYKGITTEKIRIYFKPDVFGSQTVAWEISK